ncbi:MAG: NF038122 family metalloprotease [Sphingomonas sp.]
MKTKTFLRVAAAAAALTASVQADAANFILNDTGGTALGTNARKGFEIAALYWSSVLTNNVTINLNIGFNTLGTGILGSTGSTTALQFNSAYYGALGTHITSTVDASAVATLRPLSAGAFGVNAVTVQANALNATSTGYLDTATRIDNDGSQNNSVVSVNTSVNKALGLTTNANGQAINYALADGSITFSDAFSFDFDPTDGIDANSFDFIGVAIHEIGHALGFRSGVDTVDAYTTPAPGSTTTSATLSRAGALENVTVMTQLDLFRYSAPGLLDWSTQGVPYFSVDGGVTMALGQDARFATGVRNGDGRQASHFKDSAAGVPQIGILDPTSARGQLQEVTALDIAAFDTIGWQTSFDAQLNSGYRFSTADAYRAFAGQATPVVPEPASWLMMIMGFGLMGYSLRRRSAKVAFA